jgi:hypothetical protein
MRVSGRIKLTLVAVLALALALFAAYVWIALHWSYSDGERAGYIQKFSKKGWLCKTWEGELLLTTLPGVVPEKFEFTVRDEAVAQQLRLYPGKRVILSYAQHKGLPGSCFGDTDYFVDKVIIGQ